jgi:hypothetical protein
MVVCFNSSEFRTYVIIEVIIQLQTFEKVVSPYTSLDVNLSEYLCIK